MSILNFTLEPESLGKLHEALVCLGKFSEFVCIEASGQKVSTLTLEGFFPLMLTILSAGFDSSESL